LRGADGFDLHQQFDATDIGVQVEDRIGVETVARQHLAHDGDIFDVADVGFQTQV